LTPRNRVPAWSPTVLGIAISVALGAFFYFKTDQQAAFATFAGLLGVTITLQLELLLQNRRIADEELQRETMSTQIESLPWLPPLLRQSLTALHAIESTYAGTVAADLARKRYERHVAGLRDLQRGFLLETRVEDHGLLQELTKTVQHSLIATTNEEDFLWWSSVAGQTYLKLQAAAIQRGVRIERIFIYREWTDAREQLTARQQALGIRTLRVREDEVAGTLGQDLIVWDEFIGLTGEFSPSGTRTGDRYTFGRTELDRLMDHYRMIESLAEPWPPQR
jgi:hypothetical protein